MESYEWAWAEALAQEHAHQQELLAALRGELGAFAGECAAALTALDAVVGLAGIGSMLDTARTGLRDAALVRDVGRRVESFEHVEAADRELLGRLANAAQLEQIVGPAPVAALQALAPLARWVPAFPPPGRRARAARLRAPRLAATEAWDASLPEQQASAAGRPAIRKRWFVVAALVAVAAVVGIALGLSGGSGKKQAAVAPRITTATGQGTPRYAWQLTSPKNDSTCNHFGTVPGSPNRAVWHHADTDGCNHA